MSAQVAPLERPDLDRTPRLASFAHGVAASFFAAMYAPNWLSVLAFACGVAGAVLGVRLARTSLRTPVLALPGLLAVFVAWLSARLVTGTGIVAETLGPTLTLHASDVILFPVGALGLSAALRSLSTRYRAFVGLEVLAFAMIALQLFVDHRFGAINRPFEIADPMLAAGRDPTLAFLLFGALAVGVVGLLMMRERSVPRAVYHFAALFALVLSCVITTRLGKLPSPPPPEGGQGENQQEQEDRGASGGAGGSSSGNRGESRNDSQRRVAVAVVVFHDDYSSPLETYYFRQESFSRFDGPRLVAGIDDDMLAEFPTGSEQVIAAPPDVGEREPVATTVALVGEHDHPFGLESPFRFAPADNPSPERFLRVYDVSSRASAVPFVEMLDRPLGSSTWSAEQRSFYTAPHPDPRYGELARRIVEELLPADVRDNPVAQVAAIAEWLGREGQYSLHHLGEDGADPATEFLFGERIGYCVHFAHSAVHLMRALGIPSRVVGGYAVPESNRQGGSSLLISRDYGHAWPEIYVEGMGWMVADVHPERSLEPPIPPPDIELTRILGEMARGEAPPPPPELPDVPTEVIAAISEHAESAGHLAGLSALLGLLALYAWKAARRVSPRFVPARHLPRAAYRSVLDALAESGIRRAHGETREAFAARLEHLVPSFAEVTRLHVAEAFGGQAHRARLETLRDASVASRRELRGGVKLWRRVLGALDPISFLTSR